MWIVKLALKHPYTFVVMALLILVLGATSIQQMRTDIFPEINIPVVTMIWTYKATEIAQQIRQIRGVQDVHLHQVMNVPKLHIDVDQSRAQEFGLTQQDVANSLLVSLSGSGQVQPNYGVDPRMGISYLVETRTPVYKLDSMDSISGLPLTSPQRPGFNSCRTWRRSSGELLPKLPTTPTCSRLMTCLPTFKDGISAATPGRLKKFSPCTVPSWRRATPLSCAAR